MNTTRPHEVKVAMNVGYNSTFFSNMHEPIFKDKGHCVWVAQFIMHHH